jgi:hypothetical protein
MTKLLMIVLVTVAAVLIDTDCGSAQAQGWCLNDGDWRSCGYSTLQECLASRAGGSSHCVPGNPPNAFWPTRSQRRRWVGN